MEPIGLALTRSSFNLGAILFLLILAVLAFVVASWTSEEDETKDEDG